MVRLAHFHFACLLLLLPNVCLASPVDVQRDVESLYADARTRLAALGEWARERNLAAKARRADAWLRPRDDGKIYLPILPTKLGALQPGPGCSEAEKDWYEQFGAARRAMAEGLFLAARRAVKQKHASIAFELVLLALEQDPDHAGARRVLGFEEYDGHWRSAYEVRKLRSGHVWDPRFGWILQSRVPRHERGERYFRGRWISEEEDDRLHRDSPDGWTIETEHYRVSTNHGREMGVQLGEKLEEFHLVWKLLFVRYYATEAQVAALFNDRAHATRAPAPLPRHRVVFFRAREDYVKALSRYFSGRIEETLGVYVDKAKTAFFFLDDAGGDDRTLYHEATHQLFHESRRVAGAVGVRHNFWILEGVALYMESLRRENGYYTLGGFEDRRMAAARYRLMEDRYYVPLETLSSRGIAELQADRNLPMLYSQMTGLTHFLVHGKDGRYRDALIEYLRAVYDGRDEPRTLEELTGTPFSQLDAEYREFLEKGPSSGEWQNAAPGRPAAIP